MTNKSAYINPEDRKKCGIYTKDRPELCKEYPFEETIDCPFMEDKNGK